MRLLQSSITAFFILILITACAPQPEAITLHTTSTEDPAKALLATMVAKTLSVTPTHTPTVTQPPPSPTIPAPLPTVAPLERTLYTLDVEFSYQQRGGRVEETIRYVNASGDALPELRLMVELARFQDLMRLTGLWWEDGTPVKGAGWQGTQLVIPLPHPLAPGQALTLKLAYEFALPPQSSLGGERPVPVGYTSRQANLVDWYPFVAPYRSGTGWLAHPSAYYGEHLVFDLADFEVNLRLLDERDDLQVAASAAARQDGDWLRYRRENARNFALSISHEYVTEMARVGEITVTSYYFPLHEQAGLATLQTTLESLELYEELFGPYPHDTLAVVEADFLDGMEYDGLYFLSKAFYNLYSGRPDDFLIAIAAHETAHQWWYGIVGSDQANEPWLDEALSTYCERLYYERYSPEFLPWWWQYRIDYYRPSGWVDTSVYNPQGSLQTYQDYRNAVYLNGARFLEDLRQLIGDQAFYAFLKDYAERYAGEIAFEDDFFATLQRHSRADLQPLLDQYFHSR